MAATSIKYHSLPHSNAKNANAAPRQTLRRCRTEAIINRLAGATTLPYFRPPYGDLDASVLADVGARGYTVTAMWAVDSLGWNGLSAAAIEERTLRLTSPGAIVIFHVGSQSQDGPALASIIQRLRASGYEFVTLGSLIAQ